MNNDVSGVQANPPLDKMTFEEIVDELERTARVMEGSDLGIEKATELYERAGALHSAAAERLRAVRARIDELREGV